MKLVTAVTTVLCGVGALAAIVKPASAPAVNNEIESPQPAPPIQGLEAVEADLLVMLYHQNTVKADSLVKGKILNVIGEIDSISTDYRDRAYIVFEAGDSRLKFNRVKAVLRTRSEAEDLRIGQKITLQCRGAGDVLKSPMLEDCVRMPG